MSLTIDPHWLDEGDPDDDSFKDDDRRMCRDHGDLFFKDSLNGLPDPIAYAQARQLCSVCPCFQACARWVLNHFDDAPFGIWAGLSRPERKAYDEQKATFIDWRESWNQRVFVKKCAEATIRRLHAQGVRKRTQDLLPECPRGHADVVHNGTYRKTGARRYICRECGLTFHEEE
jgi:hypothetical protein